MYLYIMCKIFSQKEMCVFTSLYEEGEFKNKGAPYRQSGLVWQCITVIIEK